MFIKVYIDYKEYTTIIGEKKINVPMIKNISSKRNTNDQEDF